MKDAWIIVLRALIGGAFVVGFAVLGELLRPKSFAGILSAAPSIALGSLIITSFVDGPLAVALAATGMIVGALAMIAACIVGIDSVKRLGSLKGSIAALGVWIAVAGSLYGVVLR